MLSGTELFDGLDPIYSVVTPSGVAIEYFYGTPAGQKRKVRGYAIRGEGELSFRRVLSVTEALECLDKPALPWWGMQMGIDGIIALIEMEMLAVGFDGERHGLYLRGPEPKLLTRDEIVDLFTKNKLTTNHVKQDAGDRGQAIHDALEAWCAVGKLPVVSEYKFDDQGYVQGLQQFLIDCQAGQMEPEHMELAVASPQHGFAGRFDLLARTHQPMRVVTKIYPKWEPLHAVVPPGRGLIDLKTSKDIYPNHLLQLAAYKQGMLECGYGEVDWMAVLHVTADGRYEFRQAKGEFENYASVLRTWHVLKETNDALKIERPKVAKASKTPTNELLLTD